MCCVIPSRAFNDRPLGLRFDENSDDLADECIHNADVRKLTELIDRLDPDNRRFVYLRYAEEMGYKEIGELLNISGRTPLKTRTAARQEAQKTV